MLPVLDGTGKIVALVVVCLGFAACSTSDEAETSPPGPGQVAALLTDRVAVVEADRVTVVRSPDNCQLLEYRGGTFANRSADWCVERLSAPWIAFDQEAKQDLERLVAALNVGRADFSGIDGVAYSDNGLLQRAEFEFSYDFGTEVFVYEPGYVLPVDDPQETRYHAIDRDWYWVEVDWL